MNFYPHTLNNNWYLADVCDYIIRTLEGAKGWSSEHFNAGVEREAYIDTFDQCIAAVKQYDMKPAGMLRALSDLHDALPSIKKPPFFSMARWVYKPLQAREQAIITAFKLVDGIKTRFLP